MSEQAAREKLDVLVRNEWMEKLILTGEEARALAALIARLEGALEHIGNPNWSAKATAVDAREMAAFAKRALEEVAS